MGTRLELHEKLVSIAGRNVYFQPPESLKLKFPCIVYELSGDDVNNADDTLYTRMKKYSVTYMTSDPDSIIPDKLRLMLYCSLDRVFEYENTYHYSFTIYF